MRAEDSTPISLHPENPHYLLWHGKPTVLVTSGEHYGAVMNAPFDHIAYLDELQSVGLNKTRVFSGVYCEAPGDYGIKDNKNILAPGPGNLLCPYARSNLQGYANGGNKFDLTRWDEAYFKRLKDFVAQADKRGIVVEFTFFCPYYFDSQWNLSPFNINNNVNANDIGDVPPHEIYTLNHPKMLAVQQALVRKIITELKDAGNLYYEILNEAYLNRTTMDRSLANPANPLGQLPWQHKIADTISEAEKDFPHKHLIAQCSWPTFIEGGYGTPGKGWKIDKPHPAVSIFNFHNVPTPEVVEANFGLNKVIAQDETCPNAKTTAFDYRRWAWLFLLAGGAIYDNLDYSFTIAQPKGEYPYWRWEAGETKDNHLDGISAVTRQQLRVLKHFIDSFDFIHMHPDHALVKGGVPDGGAAYVLAKSGEAYAIYLHGGKQATLALDLPAGRYRTEWVNTLNGNVDKSEMVSHGGGILTIVSPGYQEDVALRVALEPSPVPAQPHDDTIMATPAEMASMAGWAATVFTDRESRQAPDKPDAASLLICAGPPFSFVLDGRPSSEFLETWKVDRRTHKIDGHRTSRMITYSDPAGGLSVRCEAVEYDDFPTVEWTLYFKNTGATDTPIIGNIHSLDVRAQHATTGRTTARAHVARL